MPEESRQSTGMPIVPGAVLKGRYRVERVIGRGGMAAVWLARDAVLDRPVAVKVPADTIAFDPGFRERFRREAHLIAALRHPNLIGIFDYAVEGERPYLVMEHVPGGSLAERIAAGAALDLRRLARELLGALGHIHAAGILHRDVKPQNVLFAEDGGARLIDFGIAKPSDAASLTETGLLLGTARYLAPELIRGGRPTARADLYSCGVVLREASADGAGAELRPLVRRLTEDDPRARPAGARAALALAERGAARGEPTRALAAPPPAGRRRIADGEGRGALGLAALSGVVAALGALLLCATPTATGPRSGAAPQGAGGQRPAAAQQPPGSERRTLASSSAAGGDAARGAALNEEGFALIGAGRYAEAVPVLERSLAAFPRGSEDIDHAYALFNLANALRLSGRPAAAIPLLERRLRIPDQTDAVLAELAAARAAAGG